MKECSAVQCCPSVVASALAGVGYSCTRPCGGRIQQLLQVNNKFETKHFFLGTLQKQKNAHSTSLDFSIYIALVVNILVRESGMYE
jgi:hypothetical protein